MEDHAAVDQEELSGIAKVGSALQRVVTTTVDKGVGPLTGSVSYAESRFTRVGRRNLASGASVGSDGDGARFSFSADVGSEDAERAIDRIVAESIVASGTAGFVTGLGGLIALPVMIPANIGGALVINSRMVGAIAHLRGYELSDSHSQAILMMVVAGAGPAAAAGALGVKLGQHGAKAAIKAIPLKVIREINKKAGFMLVAKYGTKRAAVTLAKWVPFVGGIVGGSVDAALTASIAAAARKAFPAS